MDESNLSIGRVNLVVAHSIPNPPIAKSSHNPLHIIIPESCLQSKVSKFNEGIGVNIVVLYNSECDVISKPSSWNSPRCGPFYHHYGNRQIFPQSILHNHPNVPSTVLNGMGKVSKFNEGIGVNIVVMCSSECDVVSVAPGGPMTAGSYTCNYLNCYNSKLAAYLAFTQVPQGHFMPQQTATGTLQGAC